MSMHQPPTGVVTRYYRFAEEYRRDALSMAASGWRVTGVRRAPDTTIITTYSYSPAVPPAPARAQMGDFEALANRPDSDLRSAQDDSQEHYSIEATMDEIALLSTFIINCALEGANSAQGLDTSLRETARANNNEGIRNMASQVVIPLLASVTSITWLHKDFAQILGELAFEQSFEKWCNWVLDYPKPLQH